MSAKTLIYGMGISGRGAAKLKGQEGKSLILFDAKEDYDMEGLIKELGLKDVSYMTGKLDRKVLDEVDTMVIGPGVPLDSPDVLYAKEKGILITGEIEEAFKAARGRLIAITGTNGKTTTTALAGDIMKAAFKSAFTVGNIGNSYAAEALNTTDESVCTAEISSFQLETAKVFHPYISAILNITPDHMNRHKTFENYANIKLSIAKNQTKDEICVINYDDEYLRKISGNITPRKFYFSMHPIKEGVYYKDGYIMYNDGKKEIPVIKRSDIELMGDHNVENVMAAVAISISMDVPMDTMVNVIKNFKAVEHRIEFVCEKKGVKYYNDSKGTNIDASGKAVHSMTSPTVLIAGGYDKGADFTDWIKNFDGIIKAMVLIGTTAPKIKETALKVGFTNIYMADDLKEAVDICASLARPGENVLLSPACASWDQFKNFEERGRLFKEYARSLAD